MKKKLLYTLATLVVLFASAGMYVPATDGGDPPPWCNPITDPLCKP